MFKMEKEHKKSTLMQWPKEKLVDCIMSLEHNNNALHESFEIQYGNCVKMIDELTEVKKRYKDHFKYVGTNKCDEMPDARPIDANALKRSWLNGDHTKRFADDYIDAAPTLDYEPVVHAHWEDDGHGYYVCSHCEDYIVTDEDGNPPPFLKNDWVLKIHRCPNCDAKMDEEV